MLYCGAEFRELLLGCWKKFSRLGSAFRENAKHFVDSTTPIFWLSDDGNCAIVRSLHSLFPTLKYVLPLTVAGSHDCPKTNSSGAGRYGRSRVWVFGH